MAKNKNKDKIQYICFNLLDETCCSEEGHTAGYIDSNDVSIVTDSKELFNYKYHIKVILPINAPSSGSICVAVADLSKKDKNV